MSTPDRVFVVGAVSITFWHPFTDAILPSYHHYLVYIKQVTFSYSLFWLKASNNQSGSSASKVSPPVTR